MFLQERLFQRHLNCLLNVFLTDTEKFIYIFEKFINTSAAYSFPSSNCQIFSHFPTKQTPRSFYPLKQQKQKYTAQFVLPHWSWAWMAPTRDWVGNNQCHFMEESGLFLFKKLSITNCFSVRRGLNNHFPSSILRILKTKNVKNLFSITISQFIQI